jgi:hypothetical protein
MYLKWRRKTGRNNDDVPVIDFKNTSPEEPELNCLKE